MKCILQKYDMWDTIINLNLGQAMNISLIQFSIDLFCTFFINEKHLVKTLFANKFVIIWKVA